MINKLQLPSGHKKLLLHSCCAPCSGDIMLRLKESGVDYTIYFYNPNIHPKQEYILRKEENLEFARNIIYHSLMMIMIHAIGLIE